MVRDGKRQGKPSHWKSDNNTDPAGNRLASGRCAMNLIVRQFDQAIGILSGTADRGIIFRYNKEYLARPDACEISHSLPLKEGEYSTRECLPFFTGLLPDGELKRQISDYLHVSESSTMKLLEALGGECAGTISLEPEDPENRNTLFRDNRQPAARYRKIEVADIAAMISRMEEQPLLAGDRELRLSLAGAQQKIALARFPDGWQLPLRGAPSTHILKPSRAPWPDLAANEFLCMQTAKAVGIPVPPTELAFFEGKPVFIIERYDRRISETFGPDKTSRSIDRIHQEDACQASGIMPDRKYQNDGGPGFADIAALIGERCATPILDIRVLLQTAVFNFLIGNCDAHGKNFSFLYQRTGADTKRTIGLAPLYDLVSTTAYSGLSTKLSMSIGGEYRIERIRLEHFLRLGAASGVSDKYMKGLLRTMLVQMPVALEKAASLDELKEYAALTELIREGMQERISSIEAQSSTTGDA